MDFAAQKLTSAYVGWRELARTDPQGAQDIWIARYDEAVRGYVHDEPILGSRDVFAATLYSLGFLGSDLRAELSLRDHEKYERTSNQRGAGNENR